MRWAVLFAFLALAGCGGAPSRAPAPTPAQTVPTPIGGGVTAGASIYQADCMSCHGAGARGGVQVGSIKSADIRWSTLSKLNPPYTDSLLRRAILQGLDQTGQPLNQAMPRWQGRLNTTQVDDLIAYLHSLQ